MRVLTRPNLGGPTRQAVALWHAMRELGCETLLVTGTVQAGEQLLDPQAAGVPRLEPAAVLAGTATHGGWVAVEELGRRVAPLQDVRALRILRALARAWRPQVVHSHTSKAGVLCRVALRGTPVLAHTFHGHVLRDYFHPVAAMGFRVVERVLARRTDLLFAVSPSCADELAELRIAPRARLRVARPAVPLEAVLPRAVARQELGIEPGAFCVAAVGRLVPVKRMDWFVTALAGMSGAHGDVWGSGPEAPRLSRMGGTRIRLRGSRADLQQHLSAYDALVIPSVREGCPLVAVEAFAAGVPVVGVDVPGVRDVLGGWGEGVLVPEGTGPQGLREAIVALQDDPAAARAMAVRAMARVGDFAPVQLARLLHEAYASVLR